MIWLRRLIGLVGWSIWFVIVVWMLTSMLFVVTLIAIWGLLMWAHRRLVLRETRTYVRALPPPTIVRTP